MAIFRIQKKEANYSVIDNTPLQDVVLSWKSKGLLCYLLSLPDDWQIYLTELCKHSRDGKSATASAINELIKIGYIRRKQLKSEDGKFSHYEYSVYEKPCTENPLSEKPNTGKRPLQSTNGNKVLTETSTHLREKFSALFQNGFNEKWLSWIRYRKEIRKALTPSTIESQLNKLVKQGAGVAGLMIDQSIEKGWTGLFDLKNPPLPEPIKNAPPDKLKKKKTEIDYAKKHGAGKEDIERLEKELRGLEK